MALIKTIAEIRAVIPRLSKLSNDANIPNMDAATREYIEPIVGVELLDDLQVKYDVDPTTLSDEEKKLVKLIQLPLAAFALLDDLPLMHATITDNGVKTAETNSMRSSTRWEYNYLEAGLNKKALSGIENLLKYLYQNKADYALWTNSDAYAEQSSFMITSALDFDKQYKLYQPLRTYWSLRALMNDVEENYFASRLGRDLTAWVKTQETIEITVNGFVVDVKKMAKKALAFLTIKHACEQFKVRFIIEGFTVITGDNDNPNTGGTAAADGPGVQLKMQAADRDGQNYLTKTAEYLVGIANGEYNEDFGADFTTAFNNSPLWVDPAAEVIPVTNGNEKRKGVYRF